MNIDKVLQFYEEARTYGLSQYEAVVTACEAASKTFYEYAKMYKTFMALVHCGLYVMR